MKTQKTLLRREMLGVRAGIANKEVRSRSVVESIKNLEAYQKAKTILLYQPMKNEVDVSSLQYLALKEGKVLYIARRSLNAISRLEGYKESECALAEVGKVVEIVIVPGLAFTSSGKRLGRGGGWYDQVLPKLQRAYKVGVCFKEQLLEEIPTEPHDVKVDQVVVG